MPKITQIPEPSPEPAGKAPRSKGQVSRQVGSVGWLFEKYLESTKEEFRDIVQNVYNAPELRHPYYAVVKHDDAPFAIRHDVSKSEGIRYRVLNPPGFWGGLEYAILQWEVTRTKNRHDEQGTYFSHAGEELLWAKDPLFYEFFGVNPKRLDVPRTLESFPHPVKPGTIIRIRPEIPHHNYIPNAARRPAEGIFVLFSPSRTPNTLALPDEDARSGKPNRDEDSDEHPGSPSLQEDADDRDQFPERSLSFNKSDLQDFSTYALVSSGIAERLRTARSRSGYPISMVSKHTAFNASFLWRLENGQSNISVANLLRLADHLGVDLTGLADAILAPPLFEAGSDDERDWQNDHDHWLHYHVHELNARDCLRINARRLGVIANRSSWIILQGEDVMFEASLPDPNRTKKRPARELLEEFDTVHLRPLPGDADIRFKAGAKAQLLEIRFGGRCTCGRAIHRSAPIS